MLKIKLGIDFHLIHMAGTRMIAVGVDGLSRGQLGEGTMAGDSILKHIPLHLSVCSRSHMVEQWIRSWWVEDDLQLLTSHGWFCEGHRKGSFLWSPPPAAARAALDELGVARHKRSQCVHIVVIPRLFTAIWRKTLGKMADLLFTLPCGHPCWGANQHEPLIVALCLPLLHCRLWTLLGCPAMS